MAIVEDGKLTPVEVKICNRLKVPVAAFILKLLKYLPRRTNAMARDVTIMSQQLVIAFNYSPGRNSNAYQTSRSLLALNKQRITHLLCYT
jgi:hypothetical protein